MAKKGQGGMKISEEQMKKLDGIGFVWELRPKPWLDNVNRGPINWSQLDLIVLKKK